MPVYNAERFLNEAIGSVLKQTYPDFELILINDRSTDRSKEICMEYGQKDGRIVFLENNTDSHGPGPARNIGLDYATGDYIYFMDADDWIDERLLECAVHRMQETNADIVQFGVIYEGNDGVQQYCWRGKDILTKEEIKKEFLKFWKESRKSLWIHFFRREVVKTVRFENIISGEDHSYVIDALRKAEKIAYLGKTLYHYRYVEGSTSHRWNPDTIECLGIIWNHQKAFLDSFQGRIAPLAYAEAAYDKYISAIIQLCTNICPLPFREKRKELQRLGKTIEFEKYRRIYPLDRQHGIDRVKYTLVKHHLEGVILLLGPVFLKTVRGE